MTLGWEDLELLFWFGVPLLSGCVVRVQEMVYTFNVGRSQLYAPIRHLRLTADGRRYTQITEMNVL